MIKQRRGPFAPGDQVQLTDPKGRRHRVVLEAGRSFHTHRGSVAHDDLIGRPEGIVVNSSGGTAYVALRPLLADYTLSMARGAAVVYPKDAAQIVGLADIFGGARVLEAGAGSGALSCWLLRAVGEEGLLVSYERRPDFAEIARQNVERYFGGPHPAWQLVRRRTDAGAVSTIGPTDGQPRRPAGARPRRRRRGRFDRIVLDMLSPWEHAATMARWLSGGLIYCYLATTTQLSRTVEALRSQGNFHEPAAWESLLRGWHVDGLAVRPEHRMIGHTGFLVTARRLAEGVVARHAAAGRRRRAGQDQAGQQECSA